MDDGKDAIVSISFIIVLCLSMVLPITHATADDGQSLREKLFVSVMDFGARGDGRGDDTGALQRALDYCGRNHRRLNVPSGRYLVTKTLTIGFYPGLQIRGEGWENTEIVSKVDGQPIIRTTDKDTHSVVIESLKLSYFRPQSTVANKSSYAIQFSNRNTNGSGIYHWIVSRVWIENAAVGIGEEQESGTAFPVWGCRFQDLLFTHVYRTAILLRQPNGVHSGQPQNILDNVKVFNTGAVNSGPVLDLIGEWRITNLDVEDCSGTVIMSDSSFANYLSSVHIERHRLDAADTRVFAFYDGDYHVESMAFHAINRVGHPFCLIHSGAGNSSISVDGVSLGGADPNTYADIRFVCGKPRQVVIRNVRVTNGERNLPQKLGDAIRSAEAGT